MSIFNLTCYQKWMHILSISKVSNYPNIAADLNCLILVTRHTSCLLFSNI